MAQLPAERAKQVRPTWDCTTPVAIRPPSFARVRHRKVYQSAYRSLVNRGAKTRSSPRPHSWRAKRAAGSVLPSNRSPPLRSLGSTVVLCEIFLFSSFSAFFCYPNERRRRCGLVGFVVL